MAMTTKERQQALILAIVVAVAGGVAFWMLWRAPRIEEQQLLRTQIVSLTRQVDLARQDLASGTVESIRQRSADFEVTLERMKELVPTGNDVATLIEEIANRARRNGVEIGQMNAPVEEFGTPFNIVRYRWTVLGHFNEIGVLMSDIAQLSRIMVPYDLSLQPAEAIAQRTLADTTGALLRAEFMLRTFVKPAQVPGAEGGAGGDR
jgi:type IV pilus assembly protein PilO